MHSGIFLCYTSEDKESIECKEDDKEAKKLLERSVATTRILCIVTPGAGE